MHTYVYMYVYSRQTYAQVCINTYLVKISQNLVKISQNFSRNASLKKTPKIDPHKGMIVAPWYH